MRADAAAAAAATGEESKARKAFDSNSISPGTAFMQRLDQCVQFFLQRKVGSRARVVLSSSHSLLLPVAFNIRNSSPYSKMEEDAAWRHVEGHTHTHTHTLTHTHTHTHPHPLSPMLTLSPPPRRTAHPKFISCFLSARFAPMALRGRTCSHARVPDVPDVQ